MYKASSVQGHCVEGFAKIMTGGPSDPLRRTVLSMFAAAASTSAASLWPARAATLDVGTTVSIRDGKFMINGRPTYAGRKFRGKSVEGLLFVSRMANAIVDDHNPRTRGMWDMDGKAWDADDNTTRFIANLSSYRRHGLTCVAINMQGGSPFGYSWNQPWEMGAFTPDGNVRPAYFDRLLRVIQATAALGMTVNLGLLYSAAARRMSDEAAIVRAVDQVTGWLVAHDCRNVLIEIGNEIDWHGYKHDIIKPERVHELITRIKTHSDGKLNTPARRLLVSTSFTGGKIPAANVIAESDYILLHGNNVDAPAGIRAMVAAVRSSPAYRQQPIMFNEDDHYAFNASDNNMLAAVESYAGWGYFDYRQSKERFPEGYQSLPIDWSISSRRKMAFFKLLSEVTGSAGGNLP